MIKNIQYIRISNISGYPIYPGIQDVLDIEMFIKHAIH